MSRIQGIEDVFLLHSGFDDSSFLLHLNHDVLHTIVKCLLQAEVGLSEGGGSPLLRYDLDVSVISGDDGALVLTAILSYFRRSCLLRGPNAAILGQV